MERLAAFVPIEGHLLADIGCGEGSLVRSLTKRGARVIGIDPNGAQLEKAEAAGPVGSERYLQAGAQSLPLESGSLDGAIFFNALHHLPLDLMDAGLAEAARVLKPGAPLYVLEPIAEGALHDLLAPVDDETFVRAKAEEALQRAAALPDWELLARGEYLGAWKVAGVDSLLVELLRIDPARRDALEAAEDAIRRDFDAVVDERPETGGCLFWLPYRFTVLRRRKAAAR
jgi:SAM-dependent methyltransferase